MRRSATFFAILLLLSLVTASGCFRSPEIVLSDTTATTEILPSSSFSETDKPAESSADATETTTGRIVEIDGVTYSYEEILSASGYEELFASETGADLSDLGEVLVSYGYRQTESDIEGSTPTTTYSTEDEQATVRVSNFKDADESHEAIYQYVVTTIGESLYRENDRELLLFVDATDDHLSVTHFQWVDDVCRFVFYFQSGKDVIRAEVPDDAGKLNSFLLAMADVGLGRDDLRYGELENPFSETSSVPTAAEFVAMLDGYGYPEELSVADDSSVFGANEDQSVYWSFERTEEAFGRTQFTMNFAYRLFTMSDCDLSYLSGQNYEGWIFESDTDGYQICIRTGDTCYSITATGNDDEANEQIRKMVEDVSF